MAMLGCSLPRLVQRALLSSNRERPMQLFHMPDEEGTQWQAAFHDFGCSPEFGEPKLEYVIFVGAYSDDRERTIELMNMGMTHAWEIIEVKWHTEFGRLKRADFIRHAILKTSRINNSCQRPLLAHSGPSAQLVWPRSANSGTR